MNQGESTLVKELREDPHYHFRYFRMTRENFEEIITAVTPFIVGKITHSRPIRPLEKLAIALRYLATGNSQISIAMSYRISPSSICNILREVLTAICTILGSKYLPKPSTETWKQNEVGFSQTGNHPNCVGAMDGKHIRIKQPTASGSVYYNYKGFFSIVLLAVVDPTYKFCVVDIGASGSQSDGGVLSRSSLGQKIENGTLGLPESKVVGDKLLPHVIVADDAFPLKLNVMKPFPGKFLPVDKRIYNYRMSRARMVVENAFGVLSDRWRVFHTAIHADLDLCRLIVEASVILHNYLISKNDMNGITTDTITNGVVSAGNWHETIANDSGMQAIIRQGSSNYSGTAAKVRDDFKIYFNGSGSVSWQNDCI